MDSYKVCSFCVMDTTDPLITFDTEGRCNHCRDAEAMLATQYKPNAEGAARLEEMLVKIRASGKGKPYDCILGLSGGTDSSWMAYKSKEWGLRPLLFHIDAGWNSEIAQRNIENIVKTLNYDLFTYVVDWEEMRDLQRSYLAASLPNQDVPQDHIFFAVLFKKTREMKINYWLSGSNLTSESILPRSWGYNAMDSIQLKAIHKRFGKVPLKSYTTLSFLEYCLFYSSLKSFGGVESFSPLNLIPYNVAEAKAIMSQKFGWQDYGKKHYESRFTKFFQAHYLPVKFGYDKRKAHLSSLIVSGEISRSEALAELEKPLYDEQSLAADKAFVLKKLGYTEEDWANIMTAPTKRHQDYPNFAKLVRLERVFYRLFLKPAAKLASKVAGR